jgi:hypothetical protein
MPNEGEAVIFEFDFKGKTTAIAVRSAQATHATTEDVQAVNKLNEKADEFATELQQEVERVCQPFASGSVTAQVEVEFEHEPQASLIVVGTAVAACVSKVAAGALAPHLAKLLENGFRRIFRRWQRPETGLFAPQQGVSFEGFSANVSPRQIHPPTGQTTPELAPEPSPQGTGLASTGQLSTP